LQLGVDFSARLLEATADEKTNETFAGQTPAQVFALAAMLIRQQSNELISNLELE
jgi:hypothetical protein